MNKNKQAPQHLEDIEMAVLMERDGIKVYAFNIHVEDLWGIQVAMPFHPRGWPSMKLVAGKLAQALAEILPRSGEVEWVVSQRKRGTWESRHGKGRKKKV